ncbi:MAG: hypothetical protein KatS3mg113_0488 [Planctomycetaceae bacterium]|nr:MAG: hypothetical protein KatS3mg113_0488 [Planctomycetaceae bacterium]
MGLACDLHDSILREIPAIMAEDKPRQLNQNQDC